MFHRDSRAIFPPELHRLAWRKLIIWMPRNVWTTSHPAWQPAGTALW